MKKIVSIILLVVLVISTSASAQLRPLADQQLDQITAGSTGVDGSSGHGLTVINDASAKEVSQKSVSLAGAAQSESRAAALVNMAGQSGCQWDKSVEWSSAGGGGQNRDHRNVSGQ